MEKQKIRAIANELINESIACNRKAVILKQLLQNKAIVEAFNKHHAGQTLQLLRIVHYRDLALQCFNALADSTRDVVSLFRAAKLLESDALKADLKNDSSSWRLAPFSEENESNSMEYEGLHENLHREEMQKFDDQMLTLGKLIFRFKKDGADYCRIRDLRDKVLAHNELEKASLVPVSLQAENLKYSELWGFIGDLQVSATLFHSICNRASFDFPGSDAINSREAKNFVKVFLK